MKFAPGSGMIPWLDDTNNNPIHNASTGPNQRARRIASSRPASARIMTCFPYTGVNNPQSTLSGWGVTRFVSPGRIIELSSAGHQGKAEQDCRQAHRRQPASRQRYGLPQRLFIQRADQLAQTPGDHQQPPETGHPVVEHEQPGA